jgi:hypothetical protein
MIHNLTYRTTEKLEEIDNLIGPRYSVWKRLISSDIESPRFIITSASNEINKHLIKAHNVNYSTIERRDHGIIVNFYSVLNHYSWVIPYEELLVQHLGKGYKIVAGNDFIRFSSKLSSPFHHKFMTRIMKERIYHQGEMKQKA